MTTTHAVRFRKFSRSAALAVAMAGAGAGVSSTAHAAMANINPYLSIRQEPTAQKYWAVNGRGIIRAFQDGQCTSYAIKMRPDIFRQGVEAIVSNEIKHHAFEAFGNWSADNWLTIAKYAHVPTGAEPRVGAIMTFQANVDGAGSDGHVAYVTNVNPDGSFSVSEMHAPVLYQVSAETFEASVASLPGISFIY